MSLQPPFPGQVLPPPSSSGPSAVTSWPHAGSPATSPPELLSTGATPRGVIVMMLALMTAGALLLRAFVDVQGVERLTGGSVSLRSAGRIMVLVALVVVAGVLALVRDELSGLAGGLLAVAVADYGAWLYQPTGRAFRAVNLLGVVAVGVGLLGWAIGALWSPSGAARRVPIGVTACGIVATAMVFLGQFLPVHRFVIGGETLTVTVLLAGFAVARRNGLWAAIGVAVGRLLIPVYYALISPRRNPFNAFFHPVTLGGCILVILAAAVGLGSAGTLPPRSAPVPASV